MIAIKVGVLSDTHIPWRAKHLPKAVWEGLQGVDLIIHCGDIVAGHVLDELGEIAPVEAVYGNMDPVDLKQKLPKTKVVTVGDFTVGIVHGDGRWRTIDNAFNAFPFTQLDCIVFGHSHIPVITEREGVIDKILTSRELKNRMQKLNMVIGVFFSEIGTELIAFVADFDGKYEELRGHLQFSTEWKSEDFKRAQEIVRQHRAEVTVDEGDLKNLKNLLHDNRDFLIALLQNPNLLENESFTNLLWALFHMAEELSSRKDLANLSNADKVHLSGDLARVYKALIIEWLGYLNHLKNNYPYLYSFEMRTNPFNPSSRVEFSDSHEQEAG